MTVVADVADRLIEAQQTRRALGEPFTNFTPGFDEASAYDTQRRVVDARLRDGGTVIGAKLGLTSQAKQRQMSVDRPIYGWLTSDMLRVAEEPLDLDGFIHPRAEPEIAFLLREVVTAPASVTSVLAATESVFSAIEIIDSRYDGFHFRLADVVADNASSAALTLGSVAVNPQRAGDLRLLGCVLRVNGEVVATAAGAAVLGHPAASVAWLINQLAARGQTLPAGSIVLSGALTDAVPVSAGTQVTAEFDGLGVARVRA